MLCLYGYKACTFRCNNGCRTFWYQISNALNQLANVSKILWPNQHTEIRDLRNKSSTCLKQRLGIDDNHILANRQIRNLSEHQDEYMEKQFRDYPKANTFDKTINVKRSNPELSTDFDFDTTTSTIHYRGFDYNIADAFQAAADLLDKAKEIRERQPWGC